MEQRPYSSRCRCSDYSNDCPKSKLFHDKSAATFSPLPRYITMEAETKTNMKANTAGIKHKNNQSNSSTKKALPYRKNPDAPKRFRSPFILFSQAKLNELKEQHGSSTPLTKMAKHVAKKWSEISLTKERDHWEEEARKDKLRYYHEKQAYKGPWRILNKRAKKDPGAPKRPMSAFLHFAQTERAKLKLKDPNLSFSEISKSLAETWKNLSEELRKPHLEWELKERATYNKKVAEFKAKKEQEKSRKEQRAKEAALRQEMEATKNNYIESSTIVPVTPFSHGGHTSSISAQPQDSNQVSLKELSYDEGNSSFSRRFRGCRRAKAYPQVKNENSLHNSNDLLGPIAVKPEPQSKLCITSQTKSSNVAKFEIGTVGQHHINFESRYNDGTHSPVPHIKKPSLLPSCTPIVVSRFPAYVPQANNIPTQKLSRDIFPWNPSPSCHRLNFDDSLPFPLNKNFDEYNMHIEESRISHATDADNLNPVDNDRGRNPNGRDSNNHSHIPVPQDIPSENPCFENVNNMEHGNNDDNDVNMNHYDEESPGTPELLDESGYMSDTNNSYVSRDIFSSIANNMNFSIDPIELGTVESSYVNDNMMLNFANEVAEILE